MGGNGKVGEDRDVVSGNRLDHAFLNEPGTPVKPCDSLSRARHGSMQANFDKYNAEVECASEGSLQAIEDWIRGTLQPVAWSRTRAKLG